ncbi:MAG TPA: nucleotidyltransferase family protein [Chryseosolibacter sp.]
MNAGKHFIHPEDSIKSALERLNILGSDLTLFVIDDSGRLLGTITDGDIRRGMLKGITLGDRVKNVMHVDFVALKGDFRFEELKAIRERLIKLVPVLDNSGKITKLINLQKVRTYLPLDAVIMAGGEGARLRPMTQTTPKPLLKIGDKAIINHNIDRLALFGVENFYITIKYLAEQIKATLGNGAEKDIRIHYIEEQDEPLGTIGSVSLIGSFKHDQVLVMNSDLLTNVDYEDFFLEFKNKNADMAVATIPYQVKIPYAVLETSQDNIVGFKEKPTYTYYSNGGIYLFKREVLDFIPKGKHYNATDLMDYLITKGKKVITYPLYCYWLDIGKPDDFQKAQEDIQHIKF